MISCNCPSITRAPYNQFDTPKICSRDIRVIARCNSNNTIYDPTLCVGRNNETWKPYCSQDLGTHNQPKELAYGPGGFWGDTSCIEEALLWCGTITAYCSHSVNGDTATTMATACHNSPQVCYVKAVELDGPMLDAAGEFVATNFINAVKHRSRRNKKHPRSFLTGVDQRDGVLRTPRAAVLIGCDIRLSLSPLLKQLIEGTEADGGNGTNAGEVSTPKLHFRVREYNQKGKLDLDNYFIALSDTFKKIVVNTGVNDTFAGN